MLRQRRSLIRKFPLTYAEKEVLNALQVLLAVKWRPHPEVLLQATSLSLSPWIGITLFHNPFHLFIPFVPTLLKPSSCTIPEFTFFLFFARYR